MAQRYWKANWSMGYAGTDNEEEVDLCNLFGLTEDEVEDLSYEKAENMVADYAYDQAVERVDVWAEPIDRLEWE